MKNRKEKSPIEKENRKTQIFDTARKLDLDEYLKHFVSFMARPGLPIIEGDINQHYRYVRALSETEFPEPPSLPETGDMLARLRKQGVLHLDEIYTFVQMISYFNRLKALSLPEPAGSWIKEIEVPEEIRYLTDLFTDEGDLNPEKEPELSGISEALRRNRLEIRETLQRLAHSSRLRDYLVDTQIHLQNGEETLLVRGGFSSVMKASVIGRSAGGFFYVLPEKIRELKEREAELLSRREAIIWKYCREFSSIMHTRERFLSFLDREFDRFDHYQARVRFAKSRDYVFVLPDNGTDIVLHEFAHPAIENPIPVSISLSKAVMLITGVNAGGKTMLLKSVLTAVFLGRYLLPMRCNAAKSRIGRYRYIETIIDDPQSVKNDISTFAGRMRQFAQLFRRRGAIVGVDEIELGTDADEAASLFRVILDDLRKHEITFVITTHHKRLASLMAGDEDVELVAALYDEKKRRPTYTFLQGSIGKSYAFETAERYGIPASTVEKARKVHGEDRERLNELIERSTVLEKEMREKTAEVEKQIEILKRKEEKLKKTEERLLEEQRKMLAALENRYNAATKRALAALKTAESAEARRLLNEAHRHKSGVRIKKNEQKIDELNPGAKIKYRGHEGDLLSLKKNEALISIDGIKMRVPCTELRLSVAKAKSTEHRAKTDIAIEKSDHASLSIKLLGMRTDEATDELDAFLSNALMHGFNEVEIIHGTGTGALAKSVSEYLKRHPKVKNFYRMPGNMGVTVAEL